MSWFYNEAFTVAYLLRDFQGFLDMRVLLYIALLLGIYAIDFQRKNKTIELREPTVKKELNEARFQALLNDIQPDFLLSGIDMIHESLDNDTKAAEEILNDFSDLLRIMLNSANSEGLTMEEDMEAYMLYARILQERLHHKIDIETDICDDCYEAEVPSFLLLLPVLEVIIGAVESEGGEITSVCYRGTKSEGNIEVEIILEGHRLLKDEVSDFISDVEVSEIIARLKSRYGQQSQFKTKVRQEMISIGLVIPSSRIGELQA